MTLAVAEALSNANPKSKMRKEHWYLYPSTKYSRVDWSGVIGPWRIQMAPTWTVHSSVLRWPWATFCGDLCGVTSHAPGSRTEGVRRKVFGSLPVCQSLHADASNLAMWRASSHLLKCLRQVDFISRPSDDPCTVSACAPAYNNSSLLLCSGRNRVKLFFGWGILSETFRWAHQRQRKTYHHNTLMKSKSYYNVS